MPLTASPQRKLNCPRCGATFTCGVNEGRCWCADESYRVPMPATADQDCLCPACLRAHAQQLSAEAGR